MNIAAEELGRDIAFWEASEPSESARVWCTLLLKEEKELYFFFLSFCFSLFFCCCCCSKHYNTHNSFWGGGSENTQLVWPDFFCFVFLFVCLFFPLFFSPFRSGVWIRCYIANKEFGEILKVTSLSTFNGEL